MKEGLKSVNSLEESFHQKWPFGKIRRMLVSELGDNPPAIVEKLKKLEETGDIQELYLVEHDDEEKPKSVIWVDNSELPSTLIQTFDFDKKGNFAGSGTLIFPQETKDFTSIEGEYPEVYDTSTKNEFLKQGLGERRLFVLNAVAQSKQLGSLVSGNFTNEAPEKMWGKLYKQGFVDRIGDDNYFKYRFKSDLDWPDDKDA